jgi:protein-tyrosine phosphatase
VRRLRSNLYFGPSVHPTDLPRLHRVGISAILSLQESGRDLTAAAMERMRAACAPRIAFHNVGIPDYDPRALITHLADALDLLTAAQANGGVVYVHCSEGINRAPSVALAHLVRVERLAVDDALREIRHADPGVRPYPELLAFLRNDSEAL